MRSPSRGCLTICLVTAWLVPIDEVRSHASGIDQHSGNPAINGGAICSECHLGSAFTYNNGTISGSTTVEASSVATYILNFTKASGGDAARAGFNLSATGGTLRDPDAGDSSVRTIGSELTHGAPRAGSAGNFSWTFTWKAPATPGSYTFYFCNNPVNFNGQFSGDGAIRCSSQAITVDPIPATAPVGRNDSYAVNPDTTLTVTAPGVLANDTDANGDTLMATKLSDPSNGTVTLNSNGSFTYTPAASFTGTDSFTYKASDGALESGTTTVTINVASDNAAPVAANDSYSTALDQALTVAAPGVLANDTDADMDALMAAVVGGPANGTLTLNTNGGFTYTPQAGFSGSDSFTYQASDGVANSGVATATITVNAPPSGGGGGGGGSGGAAGGGGGGGAMGLGLLALLCASRLTRQLRGLNFSNRRCISP